MLLDSPPPPANGCARTIHTFFIISAAAPTPLHLRSSLVSLLLAALLAFHSARGTSFKPGSSLSLSPPLLLALFLVFGLFALVCSREKRGREVRRWTPKDCEEVCGLCCEEGGKK
jgi:Na+/H+ antiporter NhaD/arsenite permease-like protein